MKAKSGAGLWPLCHLSLHLLWESDSKQADGKEEESSCLLTVLGRGGKSEDSKFFNLQVSIYLAIDSVSYSNMLITLRSLETKHIHFSEIFFYLMVPIPICVWFYNP